MLLSELLRQLGALYERDGDMKIYVHNPDRLGPDVPLERPVSVHRDVFCPDCGTSYGEVVLEDAPDEYFEDNPCC